MPDRAYWKGHIKLSLVTCPVMLYPAVSQSERTHFHQINRKTGHRLRQQMIDEVTGKPVDKADKARGYEVSEGNHVEITPEELEAIEIESTHTIDIESFVPEAEIDKRYYDRPYYVVPDGKMAADAFVVIRDAMKDKGRVALASVVLGNREHIVALEAWDSGMLCTTLRYDYEVRPANEVFADIPAARVSKEMVDLAAHILDSKAGKFDPGKFKDQYELALRKLVEQKTSGRAVKKAAAPKPASNVIDLMAALRKSLGQTSQAQTSKASKVTKAGKSPAKKRRAG